MRTCEITDCNKVYLAKGYCVMHYSRVYRYKDVNFTKIQKHGKRHTPEYSAWIGIKARCFNKANPKYKDYGARGITVCDKWLYDFTAFFNDMGLKPSLKHSIDRINNDGNYEPDNCRWATAIQQANNRRPRVR